MYDPKEEVVYQPDSSLRLPNRATRIWRFMELPALLYILQRHKLFFRAVNKMTDPYDGEITDHAYRKYWAWEKGVPPECPAPGDIRITAKDIRRTARNFTCVNCWHMNSVESAAMWALYSFNNGVAIQSTVSRLIQSLRMCPAHIQIGAVQYVDFDRPRQREAHLVDTPMFVKRKSFSHERELRAAIMDSSVYKEKLPGLPVEANVATLIEKIFISPLAENWLTEVIREEVGLNLRKRDLGKIEVKRSTLYSKGLG
jgi:hypothetical protein